MAVLSSQRISIEKCEFVHLGGTAVDITWGEGCVIAVLLPRCLLVV